MSDVKPRVVNQAGPVEAGKRHAPEFKPDTASYIGKCHFALNCDRHVYWVERLQKRSSVVHCVLVVRG